MPLLAIGVSHHDVDSEQLGTLAARTDALVGILGGHRDSLNGWVLLTTCNRVEVYLDAPRFHPAVDTVLAAWRGCGASDAVLAAVQVHAGEAAVAHLFEVAAGLDSMVIGENEIHGQVRAALAAADGSATATLRRAFQDALSTAKTITTATAIGATGRSVASVGLDLLAERHSLGPPGRVLVLGTGAYAGVVVATLARRGWTEVAVHSATGRAPDFAASHGLRAVDPDRLADELAEADLVVTVSGAGERVLTAVLVARAAAARKRLIPVLDLSARGDLPPEVAASASVDVVTLDDIGAHAPAEQAGALLAARDIVARAVAAYLHVEEGRTAAPAVTAMRGHVMQIIEAEIEQARRRYDDTTADAVARSLRRVSGALLHTPSVRAAELARTGDLEDYRRAMRTLFGIDVEVAS